MGNACHGRDGKFENRKTNESSQSHKGLFVESSHSNSHNDLKTKKRIRDRTQSTVIYSEVLHPAPHIGERGTKNNVFVHVIPPTECSAFGSACFSVVCLDHAW